MHSTVVDLEGHRLSLNEWRRSLADVASAVDLLLIQVDPRWFIDESWFPLRDQVDLQIFRRALTAGGAFAIRRLMLYDPPSDIGGDETRYQSASQEHQEWIRRVRRQVAACGGSGSAGKALPEGQDYQARLLILDRVGAAPPPAISDGIWLGNVPSEAAQAWEMPGLIPLDPHEEEIIGPHRDRNPLWQGAFLD